MVDCGVKYDPCLKELDLHNWSKDERFILYGIQKHNKGPEIMQKLQQGLPNKTMKEIQAAIAYYRCKALHHPAFAMQKSKIRRAKTKPLDPLASWTKKLTDNLKYKDLQTDIPLALHLIADLEDIAGTEECEGIDFRMIYHEVADAMEGKSPVYNNLHAEVIKCCLLDTTLTNRSFVKPSTYKSVVNAVSFKDVEMPVFSRPTKDINIAIIRNLASERNYNPLGISEDNFICASATPLFAHAKRGRKEPARKLPATPPQ